MSLDEKKPDILDNLIHNKKKKDEESDSLVKVSSGIALLNDLTLLFSERNETGDLVFILSNEIKFRIHNFVLMARSKWYRRFYNDQLNSNQVKTEDDDLDVKIKNNGTEFTIVYDNKEVFEEFVCFLYLATCNLNWDNILELLKLSIAFQVNSLKSLICEKLCKENFVFTKEDLVLIYRLAIKSEHKQLIEKSIENINENAAIIVGTEQWAFLTKKRPDLVLEVFVSAK